MATSGPDGNQASSGENSSFHTDDEKDAGREIATLYPTAALDIKLNNLFQDWEDRPCRSRTDSGNAVTIEVEDDDTNILQARVNMILGLVPVDKAVSFYVRQLLLVAEQNLQDELQPIFIYQSFLLTRFIIGRTTLHGSTCHQTIH